MRGVHTSYPEIGLLKECQGQCEREEQTTFWLDMFGSLSLKHHTSDWQQLP